MKEVSRINIPLKYENQIKSLCWIGDFLIDYVSGNVGIGLDGSITDPRVNFGYRFDCAIATPDGNYSVIYERYGTKGLILNRGNLVREINRSYYCADAYEYPVCFLRLKSNEYAIAHCPNDYNVIEIENAETGRVLTMKNRETIDFFHSRLEVSPNQKWLLSAGWIWHPLDSIQLYDIASDLGDPKRYAPFGGGNMGDVALWEINNATFIGDSKLLISGTGDQEAEDMSPELALALYDLDSMKLIVRRSLSEPTGKLLALNKDYAIGFYGHPKMFDISTGEVVIRWKDIQTDERNSSISFEDNTSIFALDQKNKRFAIATPNSIEVVTLK